MRLDHLAQPIEPQPEHAGAEYVDPAEAQLRNLRVKANEAIRKARPGTPVLVHVQGVVLSTVKKLAEQCQQAGWVTKIAPVQNLADRDPLPSGAVLMLTKPEGDGAPAP